MTGIVLTTDFSDQAQRAFGPARELAAKLRLPLLLVTVVENVPLGSLATGAPVVWPDRAQIKRDFAERLAELAQGLGPDVRSEVIDGADVASAIVGYAQEHQADFIAMATHGRSGLRRLLVGSVVESVLRRATVPVLVFPPPPGK